VLAGLLSGFAYQQSSFSGDYHAQVILMENKVFTWELILGEGKAWMGSNITDRGHTTLLFGLLLLLLLLLLLE